MLTINGLPFIKYGRGPILNNYIMSNEKKSALEAMLSQYETATAPVKQGTAYNKDNYFSTYLPDDVDQAIKRVRILPTKDGSSPFIEVHVHSAKVDGTNRKFTCISKQNDEACPFCEAREKLIASGLDSDKEFAKNYRPRKMYVVKVIDRENEDHGPKFWRFASNFKKEGILDKIMANVRLLQEDIADAETGFDCYLNIERVKNPRGGTYPSVTSVMFPKSGVLSENAEEAEAWINDKKTWEDVYSIKGYDYLEIVVKGGSPVWSKAKDKYVDKASLEAGDSENVSDELEAEIKIGGDAEVKKSVATEDVVENTYTAEVDVAGEQSDDDLPF